MDESSQTELTNSELPVSQLTAKAQAKPRRQNPLKPISTKRNRAPPPLEPLPSYEPFKRFPFEAWKPKIAKKSPLQILISLTRNVYKSSLKGRIRTQHLSSFTLNLTTLDHGAH